MNFPQMDGVFLKVIFLQFSSCEKDSVVIIISLNNLKAIKSPEKRRAAGCGDGPWSIPEAPNGLNVLSSRH